jgi:V/A-type H+-transporting ATPase subunit K
MMTRNPRTTVFLLFTILAVSIFWPILTAHDAAAVEGAAEKTAQALPEHWAFSKFMWASIALSLSALGTSWAQSKIGVAGAGAMAEKPELAGTFIILIAIPETMVILGFVISAMIIFA